MECRTFCLVTISGRLFDFFLSFNTTIVLNSRRTRGYCNYCLLLGVPINAIKIIRYPFLFGRFRKKKNCRNKFYNPNCASILDVIATGCCQLFLYLVFELFFYDRTRTAPSPRTPTFGGCQKRLITAITVRVEMCGARRNVGRNW